MKSNGSQSVFWIAVSVVVCIAVVVALFVARGDMAEEGPGSVAADAGRERDAGDPVSDLSERPADDAAELPEIEFDDIIEERERKTGKARVPIVAKRSKARQGTLAVTQAYWAEEDKVFDTMPKYEEVRDRYRKLAEERLAGIDPKDTEAIIAIAAAEREEFWNKGSLANADAYEHGFLASAVMELACERDPDNFTLLSELKESLSTISPVITADWDFYRYMDSRKRMWPVIEKQYEMVMAGKVEASPEAMLAVYDWISHGIVMYKHLEVIPRGNKDLVLFSPGWQWLVDNADEGGWSQIKDKFQEGLDWSKKKTSYGFSIYLPTGSQEDPGMSTQEKLQMLAKYGRRVPSLRGSKEYRNFVTPSWAHEGDVSWQEYR